MNKIDEIALRVAEEQTRKVGEDPTNMWDEETKEFIVGYAHALLAELSKDAEPVGYVRETRPGEFKYSRTSSWGPDVWKPLFTHPAPVIASEQKPNDYVQQVADHCDRIVWRGSYIHLRKPVTSPPNTADIEQRVAEACANVYLDTYDLTDIADDVRSGKWKEYL